MAEVHVYQRNGRRDNVDRPANWPHRANPGIGCSSAGRDRKEVAAVGRAAGVNISDKHIEDTYDNAVKAPAAMKLSMQRDMERGGRLSWRR